MAENQEFLSPHQCFIIYDDFSKKVALSIRNRLSEKGVKCTTWDEKHFRDNEFRMSNFNRLLILNDKIAEEYLANPAVCKEISDYVIFKQEGRVASLQIADKKAKYNEMVKEVEEKLDEIKKCIAEANEDEVSTLHQLSAEELSESLSLIPSPKGTPILPLSDSYTKQPSEKSKNLASKIGSYGATGVAIAIAGAFPIAGATFGASLLAYSLITGAKSSNKCKEMLLFCAAIVFERDYIEDFINAQ